MTETERRSELTQVLMHLSDELDITQSRYEDAKKHYEAVGTWLGDDPELAPYNPIMYPQGSFALGTAITPVGNEEYDVDAVCLLDIGKAETTQERLKDMVGKRLKAHKTYVNMLDPKDGGRRCWTIKYSDASNFHLDILPAIPDDFEWLVAMGIPKHLAQHAICLTDKTTWKTYSDWPKSNPKGFAEWFRERMRRAFEDQRRLIAEAKRAEVQDIPDYEVRTPLQRVIQLLKRHRDVRFNGDTDKPISMIITALAARAYGNESDIVDAFINIVRGMRLAIQNRNGILWVQNPINPQENYAEKWAETHRKAEVFFKWLDSLEQENKQLLAERDLKKTAQYLSESYGQRDASAAMTKYSNDTGRSYVENSTKSTIVATAAAKTGSQLTSRFDVPHREKADSRWPIILRYNVVISARASRDGFRTFYFKSESQRLEKYYSLRFEASTNVPEPFGVYWQVVNTGDEATMANGLRGSIFVGDLVRIERTLYSGFHWIECFIVKDERCVARSGEFIVNIE